MRHFIIATHAYMAKGITSSLELILGKREDVSYYCAYVEPDVVYKEEVVKEINSYSLDDEIIIMTDMFGGSVNNELSELMTRDNVHIITGVNLVLLISMVVSNEEENISTIIRRNVEEAKKGIIYCNDLNKNEDSSLDEF